MNLFIPFLNVYRGLRVIFNRNFLFQALLFLPSVTKRHHVLKSFNPFKLSRFSFGTDQINFFVLRDIQIMFEL
jgi:hypothetical protein